MQNHFHTDAVQIFVTALGVLLVFHALRITGAALADSKSPLLATIGKGIGGAVTFTA